MADTFGGLTVEQGRKLALDPGLFVAHAYEWPELCGECQTDHGQALGSGHIKCLNCGEWVLNGASPQQMTILADIRDGHRFIVIPAGHGVGKTALLAWLQHWFLLTRPKSLVPCTAPSATQLEDVLWAESQRWMAKLRAPFKGLLEPSKSKIRHLADPKFHMATARTARKENPDALAGLHAEYMLYLIDEAPGVCEEVYETAEGALTTKNVMTVMIGNPTKTEGTFHYNCTKGRNNPWRVHRLSCIDSPSMVASDYIERMASKYGENSNVYRIRVLGQFPHADPDTLIAYHLAEDALTREIKDDTVAPVLGVDCARFGDDESVVIARRGRDVFFGNSWRNKDTMQTAALVANLSRELKPSMIFVDSIGIGAGVADRLRQMGFPVTDVQVSERASANDQYERLRDELWWKMREFFEARTCHIDVSGFPDSEWVDDLIGQLTSVKYATTPTGKIRVESKSERKKRLSGSGGISSSPDKADALMMTFTYDVAEYLHSSGSHYQNESMVPEVFDDGV